jgi:hypothetical protein
MGEMRNTYKILVGRSEGKGPLQNPSHEWEDIKMDLNKYSLKLWTGFVWLRIWFIGSLL